MEFNRGPPVEVSHYFMRNLLFLCYEGIKLHIDQGYYFRSSCFIDPIIDYKYLSFLPEFFLLFGGTLLTSVWKYLPTTNPNVRLHFYVQTGCGWTETWNWGKCAFGNFQCLFQGGKQWINLSVRPRSGGTFVRTYGDDIIARSCWSAYMEWVELSCVNNCDVHT